MRARSLLLLACLAGCGADDSGSKAKAENLAATDDVKVVALNDGGIPGAADAAPAIRYPASKTGLRTLTEDILEALAANDAERANRIAETLALPDPEAWFGEHFGPEIGAKLAAAYGPAAAGMDQMVAAFATAQDAGQSVIDIDRFTKTSPYATGYQALVFERARAPVTLYSIRLTTPDAERGLHLWSFIHDGDTFRWAGKMKALAADADRPDPVEVTPEGQDDPVAVDVLELPIRDVAALSAPGQ